jgi:hypothetical protein
MCVTWFLRINRKKGKDYTTVTAQQVAEWIADKFGADVQPKAAQNALRFLTTHGRLIRMDHKVSGWKTIYRYSLPVQDAEVPVVFLDKDTEVHEQGPLPGPNRPPLTNSNKRNKIHSIKEAGEVLAPKCVDPQPTQEQKWHPVIRKHPETPKPSANKNPYQSPNDVPDDLEDTTQGSSGSGVINDVQPIESSRLLSDIEKTTLSDLGAPDMKSNPAAYLNWAMTRLEKTKGKT